MSLVNLTSLSKNELVLHFIVSCRNQGTSVPYSDLLIIDAWVKEMKGDTDSLLLILSEILPKYYLDKKKRAPLRNIQKSVNKAIREHLLTSSDRKDPETRLIKS